MGRTVDIPAHVFAVDIPDLFYRGVVLKKDRAHTGMLFAHRYISHCEVNALPLLNEPIAIGLKTTLVNAG